VLTFFIDRSIDSSLFTDPLKQAAVFVELHRTHFVHDTKDTVWITEVAKRDWIIVTADEKISFNDVEKKAVKTAKAKVLHLTMGKNAYFPDLAVNFLNSYRLIERTFYTKKPPCVAVLTKPNAKDFQANKSGHIRIVDVSRW
jgi:hypothetical protein